MVMSFMHAGVALLGMAPSPSESRVWVHAAVFPAFLVKARGTSPEFLSLLSGAMYRTTTNPKELLWSYLSSTLRWQSEYNTPSKSGLLLRNLN